MSVFVKRSVPRSSSDDHIEKEAPSLGDIIEEIGFGSAQLRQVFLGGGAYFGDGSELLLIAFVTSSVSIEWSLTHVQRGSIVTIVFVGVMFGNLISGLLCDWLGRKGPLLIGYVGLFVFSVASACSIGFLTISLCRFGVGVSFGIGVPAFQTVSTEITPTQWRLIATALGQIMFAAGEIFSAGLLWWDDPELEDLHWRWLLCVASIPSLVFLVLNYYMLVESPRFLAMNGRHAEAKEVLRSLARSNGALVRSFDYASPSAFGERKCNAMTAFTRQLTVVFGSDLRMSTFIVVYTCFVLNFSYFGTLYALPRVIGEVKQPGVTRVFQLTTGACMEIMGTISGVAVSSSMGRKQGMRLYLVLQVIAIVSFVLGLPRQEADGRAHHPTSSILLFGGFYSMKVTIMIGFLVVYQYSAEVYPTMARATGCSFCFAGGRIASMTAPLVFERSFDSALSSKPFFVSIIACSVVNLFLIGLLPYETAGRQLSEDGEID
eukprot:TRINITY_DN37368_c0_g1_i1.p1 TRINITY_DN37368_c0_g1~~TRINITY_DN37368_c0_g1_i1.p1  ORF type:complete len:490 (+),score=53.84 TRINITY_DN37368_c0_g1_i1:119-1588(+)